MSERKPLEVFVYKPSSTRVVGNLGEAQVDVVEWAMTHVPDVYELDGLTALTLNQGAIVLSPDERVSLFSKLGEDIHAECDEVVQEKVQRVPASSTASVPEPFDTTLMDFDCSMCGRELRAWKGSFLYRTGICVDCYSVDKQRQGKDEKRWASDDHGRFQEYEATVQSFGRNRDGVITSVCVKSKDYKTLLNFGEAALHLSDPMHLSVLNSTLYIRVYRQPDHEFSWIGCRVYDVSAWAGM